MTVSGGRKVSDNKWTLTALAVVLGALFLTRGGAASLIPLLRLFLPVVIVVLVFRVIKGRFRSLVDDAVRRGQGQMGGGPGPGPGPRAGEAGAVIDLCPKCGAYLKPGHRCQR